MSTKVDSKLRPDRLRTEVKPLVDIKPPRESTLCPNPPRTDMAGSWIWVPDKGCYNWRNSYAYFRKNFNAEGKLSINIAADTQYDLFIDGKRIDRGTAPADVAYKTFDTHVVNVGPGDHVIAVLVHHLGQSCATAMQSRPGLFVEMITQLSVKIVTDSTWKVLPSAAFEQDLPCMMSHFGFNEVCDCRKIPQGWTQKCFDDRSWYKAGIVGKAGCEPWLRMIPRDIPLLATTQISTDNVVCRGTYKTGPLDAAEEHFTVAFEMAGRRRKKTGAQMDKLPAYAGPDAASGEIERLSVSPILSKATNSYTLKLPINLAKEKENEFVVIDFGREVTGHLRLDFCGASDGQQVDIGYDETLDDNGLPNPRRTYVHFADRFYLSQEQHAIEVFNARGFRYLMIDVAGDKTGLTLTRVQIEERLYPVTTEGSFQCSSKALEKLYQIGTNTTKLCMLDTYVDCPSRERVMWMDSYLEGLCSSYGMGITRLWRRALYLFAQNSCKRGVLAGAVKAFAPCDDDPMVLSYVMYYVCSVSDYFQHSGDRKTCKALFETLMKQFEVLKQFTTKEGLLNDKWPSEWDTFTDWSAMDNGGVSASNNAIYIKMHKKMARLAQELQRSMVARKFKEKADKLAEAFRKTFWSEEEELFVDAIYDGVPSAVRSQLTNVLAIWAEIVNHDQARSIIERITNNEALLPMTKGDYRLEKNFKPQTGGIVPIGTPGLGFLMAYIMFELGMDREAIDYLEERWPPLAKNGTFSEHFLVDDNTSFCHGWSAGPVALLPRFVLGVRPVAAGWEEIEVVPHPGNLQWAEGTIPTPHGDIKVSWKKVSGKLKLSVKVPDGIRMANQC